MEKIIWIDDVKNEEILHRVKEEKNIIHTTKRRKGNSIGHILHKNCLLKHITEENIERRIEVTVRRGRRCKQVPE
jgi:hypothetical protein